MAGDLRDNVVLVYVTVPVSHASKLAQELVSSKLAACVNRIDGIESTYSWEGRIVTDKESLLLCKSTSERAEQIIAFIRDRHPYSVPGISVLRVVDGHKQFLDWIVESVKPE